jgi:UDPglucose 6-dehydrogenase
MKVAVLGAAFKPNSDDIRDSPALDVAATIQRQGEAVCVYDPEAMDNARVLHHELG